MITRKVIYIKDGNVIESKTITYVTELKPEDYIPNARPLIDWGKRFSVGDKFSPEVWKSDYNEYHGIGE